MHFNDLTCKRTRCLLDSRIASRSKNSSLLASMAQEYCYLFTSVNIRLWINFHHPKVWINSFYYKTVKKSIYSTTFL